MSFESPDSTATSESTTASSEVLFFFDLLAIACSLFFEVIAAGRSTTGADPGVNVVLLELPESSNFMTRHALARDPRVNGVFCYAEILGDLVYGEPTIVHTYIFSAKGHLA